MITKTVKELQEDGIVRLANAITNNHFTGTVGVVVQEAYNLGKSELLERISNREEKIWKDIVTEIPSGHALLGRNVVLKEGDKYWTGVEWSEVKVLLNRKVNNLIVVRPMNESEPVKTTPSEIFAPDGWYVLRPGTEIKPGDKFAAIENATTPHWIDTSISGKVPSHVTYIRKLPQALPQDIIPDGWYKLNADDVVCEGDKFYSFTSKGWRETNFNESDKMNVSSGNYIRKSPEVESESADKIPEGWYKLPVGAEIEEGDKYFSVSHGNVWLKTRCAGGHVNEGVYIRPLSEDKPDLSDLNAIRTPTAEYRRIADERLARTVWERVEPSDTVRPDDYYWQPGPKRWLIARNDNAVGRISNGLICVIRRRA